MLGIKSEKCPASNNGLYKFKISILKYWSWHWTISSHLSNTIVYLQPTLGGLIWFHRVSIPFLSVKNCLKIVKTVISFFAFYWLNSFWKNCVFCLQFCDAKSDTKMVYFLLLLSHKWIQFYHTFSIKKMIEKIYTFIFVNTKL